MKFICFAVEEEALFHAMPRAEWEALREETLAYVDTLQEKGHLLAAHPLKGARTARTLQVRGGELSVIDGPFVETKEQIGGFFLLEASGIDEAVRLAARWPSARLGRIEVRPLEEGLDPERRYEAPPTTE